MEKPSYSLAVKHAQAEPYISPDLSRTTQHDKNFVDKYPLPFIGNPTEVCLSYARKPTFVKYENSAIDDLDHIVVESAGARKWGPVASRGQDNIRIIEQRPQCVINLLPK